MSYKKVQPATTNSRGNILTTKTTQNDAPSSNPMTSKVILADTDPTIYLPDKDSANLNQIQAIGILNQYAYRPT